jgi:SAM-dependent methyltransferase
MRPHNHAFVQAAARHFDCPGPVVEFGAFQVEGQLDIADLRGLFPGKPYLGCDMRPGLGVDRVEDVTAPSFPDHAAGTVLCVETFEHVFHVWKAFEQVFRILRPGGVFLLTSPFHFHIHGYPDDYWRMTPSCLRRMLEPFGARVVGSQGHETTPHTVMSLAVKDPVPADFHERAEAMVAWYNAWLAGRPAQPVKRAVKGLFRSKSERAQIRDYDTARFHIDTNPGALRPLGKVG